MCPAGPGTECSGGTMCPAGPGTECSGGTSSSKNQCAVVAVVTVAVSLGCVAR